MPECVKKNKVGLFFFFLLLCCTTEQWTVDCRFQRCLLVKFDWLMSVGKYEAVIMVFALRSGLPPSQHLQLEHLFVRADRNVFCFPRLFLRGVPQRLLSRRLSSPSPTASALTRTSTRTWRVAHWASGVGVGRCQSHVSLQGNTSAGLGPGGLGLCWLWFLLYTQRDGKEWLL